MDMMEEFAFYGSLILRCIIVYFVIIFALRVMGKREVGELSVFDVVIYLVMSELLAISHHRCEGEHLSLAGAHHRAGAAADRHLMGLAQE